MMLHVYVHILFFFPIGLEQTPKRKRKAVTPKTKKMKILSTKLYYMRRKIMNMGRGGLSHTQIIKSIKCMVSPVIYQFIATQLKFSRVSKFGRR